MAQYKIIQLAHPGKEWPNYSASTNEFVKSNIGISWENDFSKGVRCWNNLDSHKRKFLFSKNATYIDDLNNQPKDGNITFWGEWEPHSNFEVISKHKKDFYGPRMMHYPFFDNDYNGEKKHTTDPYVFGDNFWYTHCKQSTRSQNQNLKNLDTNSVIIMGSERNEDKKFLVDTIFVIKKRYSQEEILKDYKKLPSLLVKTNLHMDESHDLLFDKKKSDFGFYQGMSYKNSDVFSFVPAKIFNRKNIGHERLAIDTYSRFYNLQRTGAGSVNRCVMETSAINDINAYWLSLVKEAFNQGFVLGVQIPEPGILNK
tara:strand:- start:703 stop:1641 length:939 start_codon:yes stop_codon:yes gene_type:complete